MARLIPRGRSERLVHEEWGPGGLRVYRGKWWEALSGRALYNEAVRLGYIDGLNMAKNFMSLVREGIHHDKVYNAFENAGVVKMRAPGRPLYAREANNQGIVAHRQRQRLMGIGLSNNNLNALVPVPRRSLRLAPVTLAPVGIGFESPNVGRRPVRRVSLTLNNSPRVTRSGSQSLRVKRRRSRSASRSRSPSPKKAGSYSPPSRRAAPLLRRTQSSRK